VIFFLHPDSLVLRKIVLIIARTILVVGLWFYFLAPVLKKILLKFLEKKKGLYKAEISSALQFLPRLQEIAGKTWAFTSRYRGLKRVQHFLRYMLILTLLDKNEEGK